MSSTCIYSYIHKPFHFMQKYNCFLDLKCNSPCPKQIYLYYVSICVYYIYAEQLHHALFKINTNIKTVTQKVLVNVLWSVT